jgi:hypothetical protein
MSTSTPAAKKMNFTCRVWMKNHSALATIKLVLPSQPNNRMVFRGFSEEMPSAADTQEPSTPFIFSPNTLEKTVNEQLAAAADPAATKKH